MSEKKDNGRGIPPDLTRQQHLTARQRYRRKKLKSGLDTDEFPTAPYESISETLAEEIEEKNGAEEEK